MGDMNNGTKSGGGRRKSPRKKTKRKKDGDESGEESGSEEESGSDDDSDEGGSSNSSLTSTKQETEVQPDPDADEWNCIAELPAISVDGSATPTGAAKTPGIMSPTGNAPPGSA